jgi:hypothetical protein
VVDTARHTDSGGPVLGTFQRGRKHMEAVMSVDDSTFRADDDGGDEFIADIEILRGDLSQVLYDDTGGAGISDRGGRSA